MGVSCFLPCRRGSERVPHKNVKPFSGYRKGLVELKISQLAQCEAIDEIILSTNDEDILNYVAELRIKKLNVHIREEALSSGTTSTDELVRLAHDLAGREHVLWTHVTSPFFTSTLYSEAIAAYFNLIFDGYDSLMSVKRLQGFIWNDDGPLNYDRGIEKWPRTQTLKPVYEVDSAVFLSSKKNYAETKDRIGRKPYLFVSPGFSGFDIDWPEDFQLAEILLESGLAQV